VGALARHAACVAPPVEAPAWGAVDGSTGAQTNPGRALVRRRTTATRGTHAGVTSHARFATVQPQFALFVRFEK
jgi:hypothetical protein